MLYSFVHKVESFNKSHIKQPHVYTLSKGIQANHSTLISSLQTVRQTEHSSLIVVS